MKKEPKYNPSGQKGLVRREIAVFPTKLVYNNLKGLADRTNTSVEALAEVALMSLLAENNTIGSMIIDYPNQLLEEEEKIEDKIRDTFKSLKLPVVIYNNRTGNHTTLGHKDIDDVKLILEKEDS